MNDLKFSFRQLLKNPGFTAVAMLGPFERLRFDSSKLTLATCPASTKFQ